MEFFKRTCLSFFCVLFGASAFAQNYKVYFDRNDIKFSEVNEGETVYFINKHYLPELRTLEDGTLEIDYGGGRIVSVGSYSRINQDVRTSGRVTEVTCLDSSYNSRCDITMGTLFRTHRLYWKRHHNPNKIGKQIRVRGHYDTGEVNGRVPIQTFLLGTFEKNFHRLSRNYLIRPDEMQALKPVSFNCENKDWVTEINRYLGVTSDKLTVNEWVTEAMEQNIETSVNENRTDMGIFGVVFDIIDGGHIQLDEFRYPLTQRDSFSSALIGGDIVGMNLAANNKVCDVSMNVNLNGVFNQITSDQPEDEMMFSPLPGELMESAMVNFGRSGNPLSNFHELTELFNSDTEMGRKIKTLAVLGLLDYSTRTTEITISSANDFGDQFTKNINLHERFVMRVVD